MKFNAILAALVAIMVSGCATDYQSSGLTGGFSEQQLEPLVWRVQFDGNGYTNTETAQTYWLYRAAELTLQNGFDGFQIISPIRFSALEPIRPGELQFAHSTPVYIPIYTGASPPAPGFQGDIQMLRRPFTPQAPVIFDAMALKVTLDPLVHGPKCSMGNVCPHVHRYLMPPGMVVPPPPPPPPPAN